MLININMPRYHFKCSNLPTQYNLAKFLKSYHWRSTHWQWLADFSDKNLDFDIKAAETLEFKHLLAYLIQQYCPEVMPVTHIINDLSFLEVIQLLSQSEQAHQQNWILKPALLNNGQAIKIFTNLESVRLHFLNKQRLGGEHVLQQYIEPPHLLNGHKYSLRMFIILTNYWGNYLYPHGYFNVAKIPYQPNQFIDLRSHLTNEYLKENEGNVIQIPTERCEFFSPIYEQIQNIVRKIIDALRVGYPKAFIQQKYEESKMAFFGFDFIVDSEFRVWLLEINHGPCFPIHPDHVLQKFLYQGFWRAVIENLVFPVVEKQSKKLALQESFWKI